MKEKGSQLEKSDTKGEKNIIKVLQLIRNNKEITRAEIINLSGLSAPTVTRIVEKLAKQNLIQTDGIGSSIGGRRPQLLSFNSKNNYVIGIDIGGTFIRSALSDLDGEFIYEIQVATKLDKNFDGVMDQVGELIEKLCIRAAEKALTIWGIGIAVCGMVNKDTDLVEFSPIFGWKNVDILSALAKYTNLKIALANDNQLIAMGELLYGVGRDYQNFICINLGYGVGSGIIIDGKLFRGANGIAGEVGHIVVDKYKERKGLEGVSGTLEALASGYGIADIAKEQIESEPDSSLSQIGDRIDAKLVFSAAARGDDLAKRIIDEAAEYYSIAIDILIKLFNTECIILSGGLVQHDDMLIDKIREQIKVYSMNGISHSVPILHSGFGENAALMGSFSLILEKILLLESI